MASLFKNDRSPFWTACFTDAAGKRIQKSTKLGAKKDAQKLADQWEDAARSAVTPPPEPMTVRLWCAAWVASHKGALSDGTFLAYEHRARHFLEHLGKRADSLIGEITKADIVAYRTALLEKISPMTVNHAVKVLRMMFEAARKDQLIPANPAADLKALKDEGKVGRRPFTASELKALLDTAAGEWRSLILFGIYTGQRLNDLALLTWQNIDTVAGEVRLRTRKTSRFMSIPLAGPLLRHIATLEAGDDPSGYVHPKSAAFALGGKLKISNTLSGQFRNLMASAGLAQLQQHRAMKQGRAVRRDMRELCFHSLRHTATSLMKNAGVSEAVVMDIIGHASPAVSAIYTHIDTGAKRKALDAMPDLL
jgi:integrase